MSDVFADAPVPADCVLRSGLVDESEEGLRYMEPPLFIAARKKDLHTRDESLTITWLTTHGWEQTDIPRAVLVQKPKCLQALATKGCPVTEHNIKEVQKALLDFEQINEHALNHVQQTERMGWLSAVLGSRRTEAFNGRFRQECLNEHWFWNLSGAKVRALAGALQSGKIAQHLGKRSPAEFCERR